MPSKCAAENGSNQSPDAFGTAPTTAFGQRQDSAQQHAPRRHAGPGFRPTRFGIRAKRFTKGNEGNEEIAPQLRNQGCGPSFPSFPSVNQSPRFWNQAKRFTEGNEGNEEFAARFRNQDRAPFVCFVS